MGRADFPEVPAQEERKQYLIYVVLDTSQSMRRDPRTGKLAHDLATLAVTPQGQFTAMIPPMLQELSSHSMIANGAAVSVVAFNDQPQSLLNMTPFSQKFLIKAPALGTATNYAKVLSYLAQHHAGDAKAVQRFRQAEASPGIVVTVARPWVFFITDGVPTIGHQNQPELQWFNARAELIGPPIEARIVTVGLPGAEEEVLWKLATGDGDLRNALVAKPNPDPAELVASVLLVIKRSVTASMRAGSLVIEPPSDMRRVLRSSS